MWLKRLAAQILWRPEDGPSGSFERLGDLHSQTKSSTVYRAPSFSWASVDGSRSAGIFAHESLLTAVDNVTIEAFTEDHTGPLKSASLVLHGSLKAVSFARKDYEHSSVYRWETSVAGAKLSDSNTLPTVYLDERGLDLSHPDRRPNLFYVPARVYTLLDNPEQHLDCLLLEAADPENGTYRRIGILQSSRTALVTLLLAVQPTESQHPCLTYETGSERPHTVRLI